MAYLAYSSALHLDSHGIECVAESSDIVLTGDELVPGHNDAHHIGHAVEHRDETAVTPIHVYIFQWKLAGQKAQWLGIDIMLDAGARHHHIADTKGRIEGAGHSIQNDALHLEHVYHGLRALGGIHLANATLANNHMIPMDGSSIEWDPQYVAVDAILHNGYIMFDLRQHWPYNADHLIYT